MKQLRLVFLGLSLSSSWGNGHATTYRSLLRALSRRGHELVFLERDQPWYAQNRDLAHPDFCRLRIYPDIGALDSYREDIASADAVIVGSYVPDGIKVADFVQRHASGLTAYYDIDTPVTLAKLASRDFEYISPAAIRRFDLYLSFSAGPALHLLESCYGARKARALYCSADPDVYRPSASAAVYDLGYLGTYSADRQKGLESLLVATARALPEHRFVVAGPLYPSDLVWPRNVKRIEHVPPAEHPRFYQSCRFTLNLTRSDMVQLGYSPSVRLFEAAASGTPIISDVWRGLADIFEPKREIALARTTEDVCSVLTGWSEKRRLDVARRARQRLHAEHTPDHRARELERLLSAPRGADRAGVRNAAATA